MMPKPPPPLVITPLLGFRNDTQQPIGANCLRVGKIELSKSVSSRRETALIVTIIINNRVDDEDDR